MAGILKSIGRSTNVPTNYYEVDSIADMNAIDTTYVTMGARCYIIDSQEMYALDSQKVWYPAPIGGGGGGGDDDVIYDGGIVGSYVDPTGSHNSNNAANPSEDLNDIVYDGGNVQP